MHRFAAARTACSRTAPALSALLATGVLVACSSAELDVEGFAPGACTDVAGTVQDADEALRQVADEEITSREAASRFEVTQEGLSSARSSAGGAVQEAAGELTSRLGFFRIAVDTGSYDDELAADVGTALQGLAQECRAG